MTSATGGHSARTFPEELPMRFMKRLPRGRAVGSEPRVERRRSVPPRKRGMGGELTRFQGAAVPGGDPPGSPRRATGWMRQMAWGLPGCSRFLGLLLLIGRAETVKIIRTWRVQAILTMSVSAIWLRGGDQSRMGQSPASRRVRSEELSAGESQPGGTDPQRILPAELLFSSGKDL